MRRDRWIAVAVVALATFLVHAGTFDAGFVYDDHRFIEFNPAIESIQLGRYFSDPVTASNPDGIVPDIYRPLRTLLFAFEYAVFEDAPAGWHVVSVLLHTLNAVLVLLLLHNLLAGGWIAPAAGALLFGVHPVTSESVAWVSSQGDLLAMTFMLSGLLVMRRAGVGRTVGGVALFALACFSKESALVLPALVLMHWIVLRAHGEDDVPSTSETVGRIAALAVAAVAYIVLRSNVVPSPSELGWMAQVPHTDGVAGSARGMSAGLVWYAQMLFFPNGFTFDIRYDIPLRWSDREVVLGLGILATVLAAGLWGLRRRPVLAFATLGFLACLVPVSNVIVPLKAFVAERFLYPGLLCVVAGLAWALLRTPERWRTVARVAAVPVLVVLAFLTVDRNEAWSDEATLWRTVREHRPDNANSYQGLAFEYAKEHRVADAERAFLSYLEFNPNDGKSQAILGDLFGDVAASLRLSEAAAAGGGVSNIDLRRKQARVAQISAYRRALEIWAQYGLGQGRGSPEQERRMLLKWMDAALELGDVAEQRFANDQLLLRDGLDPSDTERVMRDAPVSRRFARLNIAVQALLATMGGRAMPEDPEVRAKLERDRAVVLRDVGLDPRRSSPQLMPGMNERIDPVLKDALETAPGTVANPLIRQLTVIKIGVLMRLGEGDRARAFLRQMIKRFPDDKFFQEMFAGSNARAPGPPAPANRRKPK